MTHKTKRRILICVLLLAAAVILRLLVPAPGECIGGWISGMGDAGTAKAVSAFYRRLSEGDSFSRAAEVFHEEFP